MTDSLPGNDKPAHSQSELTKNLRIGVVVLAAGCSSRFGADKRQKVLPSGLTLLEHTVAHYCRVVRHCLVVLDDAGESLGESLEDRFGDIKSQQCELASITVRPAQPGMGYSIASAAEKLQDLGWDAGLIALADMPFVRKLTIQSLVGNCSANKIVVPTTVAVDGSSKRGHPVGFGREFFGQLRCLSGDEGARGVLQANPDAVLELAVNDSGILIDIDTPEDYLRYLKTLNRYNNQ